MKDHITLNPAGSHEECFLFKKGQVLIYKFISSRPVDFNIHYHGKDQVHYPVSNSAITEDDGIIDPATHQYFTEEQEYYCMMWENTAISSAHVSYEYEVREK